MISNASAIQISYSDLDLTEIFIYLVQLIVDTGSSNTWVGAGTKYVASSTSHDTGDKVSVSYGSGSFSGIYSI